MRTPRILVFASGSPKGGGSGFRKLVEATYGGPLKAGVLAVVSNHENGGVRAHAKDLGVPFLHFPKPWDAEGYQRFAEETEADFFMLSGWLKRVVGFDPETKFNLRTIANIHPGLLPEFGGDGLYGHHVHEAVIAAYKRGEITHSGLSMHFLSNDGEYDRGPVFFRFRVKMQEGETADSIGTRVNQWEHRWQPEITNLVVNGQITWDGVNHDSLVVPPGYEIERSDEE